MKDIYKLDLHESIEIDAYDITSQPTVKYIVTRVASGWLYSYYQGNNTVFVPFDNAFQKI